MGWISSKWGVSENNRRAKYYSITRAGKKQLAAWVRWSILLSCIAALALSVAGYRLSVGGRER
jgi:PadR family transcriptional regulator, regulatory protein PadR